MIKFKVHIQQNLEEYEQFVSDEVEKQAREQEEDENGEMDVDGHGNAE